MIQEILPVIIISVLALGITVVLFKWLDSYAEAKGTHLGGKVKYGGGLAGFVVVTSVLLLILKAFDTKATNVSINGEWKLQFVREDGFQVFGSSTITQRSGERDFYISGEVTTDKPPGYVSFSTKSGTITGREIVFVYLNSRKEEGLARGILPKDEPDSFRVNYFDSIGADENNDAKGTITFIKISG